MKRILINILIGLISVVGFSQQAVVDLEEMMMAAAAELI